MEKTYVYQDPEQLPDADEYDDATAPLNVVNPAGFQIWWQHNKREKWKIMLQLIYEAVTDMGQKIVDMGAYAIMQKGCLS